MKTLFTGGTIVNVFSAELIETNLLIENDKIVGFGDCYTPADADCVVDVTGKFLAPGFIDGHIHIESSLLTPTEFTRAALPHGTTAVMADPHEIANVLGVDGIRYMLEGSCGLPLTFYFTLPSCVPASPFDEAGAVLTAADLLPFYQEDRVLGLGEVMNYPGVLFGDPDLMQKIRDAEDNHRTVNGHAPLLSGKDLDTYIARGIRDDHECVNVEEALDKLRRGQYIMIRQGGNHNLEALLPLFDGPTARRCLLVSDDKHSTHLLSEGHLDAILKMAVAFGKDPITAISMVTINTAEAFNLKNVGAIAPGYRADLVVLNDLKDFAVAAVYTGGKRVAEMGSALPFAAPAVSPALDQAARSSFHLDKVTADAFRFPHTGRHNARIMRCAPYQILTDHLIESIDFDQNGGVDVARDIVKIAVLERHKNTGHVGLGLIMGSGMRNGALAASVSHDSHNLVVMGTSDTDMALAAETVRLMGGGSAVVQNGTVLSTLPLPIAGLMSDGDAASVARQNEVLNRSMLTLGVPDDRNLFMNMAFMALTVIPHLKISTNGLFDVDAFQPVELLAD